jgi:hypothetical protein
VYRETTDFLMLTLYPIMFAESVYEI